MRWVYIEVGEVGVYGGGCECMWGCGVRSRCCVDIYVYMYYDV